MSKWTGKIFKEEKTVSVEMCQVTPWSWFRSSVGPCWSVSPCVLSWEVKRKTSSYFKRPTFARCGFNSVRLLKWFCGERGNTISRVSKGDAERNLFESVVVVFLLSVANGYLKPVEYLIMIGRKNVYLCTYAKCILLRGHSQCSFMASLYVTKIQKK